MKACSQPGCSRPFKARGLCKPHYNAAYKRGLTNLFLSTATKKGEPLAFIHAHMNYAGTGCLVWPFGRYENGYGALSYENTQTFAHRVMCRLAHGEPAYEDLEASHICENGHSGCVNPSHLVWETHAENHARRRGKRKNAR